MTNINLAATYYAHSLDGVVPIQGRELISGVGTEWSDQQPIPVTLSVAGEDIEIGLIDPCTGHFEAAS